MHVAGTEGWVVSPPAHGDGSKGGDFGGSLCLSRYITLNFVRMAGGK